ncbi:hypothetical protein [Acidovorax sp. NB1]|uniref:hypothetical protein n=1 Tax=Acidovorax sp. NB1 TaxID=1943571 RepID=UPI0010D0E393|nr:hypothetical protein [Acidovorax sp. NB1]GDY34417.1 hypothetical protein ACINB_03090 [Acidovorax sp. NB1]
MATLNPTPLNPAEIGSSHVSGTRSGSPTQQGVLMGEITLAASRIAQLAVMAQDLSNVDPDVDALLAVMHTLAQRVGWMAEVANAEMGGVPFISASVEDWLLPPAFSRGGVSSTAAALNSAEV